MRKRKRSIIEQNKQRYFEFLDDVGRSGLVRMSVSSPILREEFPELSYREAIDVLQDWISSFPRNE